MSKWPSEKHFASWVFVSPRSKISGGKVISKRSKKASSTVTKAFRNAASTLRSSNTYLGAFYRKIKARSSLACALIATARKLAIIVYHMLDKKTPFLDLGPDYLPKLRQDRIKKNITRQTKALGLSVTFSNLS